MIAITGGIGSGKSMVSRIVQVMGYQVYDCDSQAKTLMVTDENVRSQLKAAFGEQTYLDDGSINRQHLSAIAFADEQTLAHLNAIVHPAVAADLKRWTRCLADKGARAAFVETALLRTARLDQVVDSVWHVTAPPRVRITRVMQRSGLTEQQVLERIAAQAAEETIHNGEYELVNDNITALMPQVITLLELLDNKKKQ